MKIKMRHKLIPAIIMLLVAAITMSTASYAWFTMSSRVEVTDIQLSVVAPINLLIKNTDDGYEDYSNAVQIKTSPASGRLNHASSVDGLTFYTVADEDADEYIGVDGKITGTPTLVATTTTVADDTDGYYIDFSIDLLNTGGEPVTVGIDNVVITSIATSTAGSDQIINAVRFAVLDKDSTVSLAGGLFVADATEVEEVTLAYSDASTVSDTAQAKIVTDTDMFDVVAGGVAANDPINKTTVIVRVWIEGQDIECITENSDSRFGIAFDFVVLD